MHLQKRIHQWGVKMTHVVADVRIIVQEGVTVLVKTTALDHAKDAKAIAMGIV